ncbi:hypothetical protein [Priestia taiwanensis]|uniref:Uncharacterized protein n=1 Tax=Priestia taiwanensis TaxID=1347902 RepID=A0A917AXN7_9BACI|nr:hypothetical protein [Priestia taiwanensis]MBM7364447.1 hypothetical protein [Priestia taiwanensis]GGE81386.1 hypothetical protein GCM10007140_33720 [Priestia taiwanensis]
MYYEKLTHIFKKMKLQEQFPNISLDEFDKFIRKQLVYNDKYISPYKFALEQSVTVNDSVKFFMYFTGDEGIFDIVSYAECSKPSCFNSRIYFDINNVDEQIFCEECGKIYSFDTIKRHIKILFKLKESITIPDKAQRISRRDPNSAYEALRELHPNLKKQSPPSLSNAPTCDGGEKREAGIDLEVVLEISTETGMPVISAVEKFKNKIQSLAG